MAQQQQQQQPQQQQQQAGCCHRVLHDHAAWASACRASGALLSFHQRENINWLLCPAAAAELCRLHDGGGCGDGSGGQAGLEKPPRERRRVLLASALTAVSGADWARQRPAFEAAAGGGPSAQAKRHGTAVRQASELAVQHASCLAVHDVVDLAQRAAARGIVGAVLGAAQEPMPSFAWASVETLVINYLRASRKRRFSRDGALISSLEEALMAAMQQQADALARPSMPAPPQPGTSDEPQSDTPAATAASANGEASQSPVPEPASTTGAAAAAAPTTASTAPAQTQATQEPVALLARLLARPELHRDEAVCNANSCLIAGTETTAAVIGCSLLHLAQRPDVQDRVRHGVTGVGEKGPGKGAASPLLAAVMKETLRVHPPVTGQPRVVVAPGGLLAPFPPLQRPGGPPPQPTSDGRYLLPCKTTFAIDLLSASHGSPSFAAAAAAPAASAATPLATASESPARDAPRSALGANGGRSRAHSVNGSGRAAWLCPFAPFLRAAAGKQGGPSLPSQTPSPPVPDPPTWEWDPFRPAPASDPDTHSPSPFSEAAPFGIGPRACPAGSLSLAVAREVLAELLCRFRWELTSPADDRLWLERTVATPTLVIKGPPIGLTFTPIQPDGYGGFCDLT